MKQILMILAAMISMEAAAQNETYNPKRSVNLEVLGASGLVGVNYDSRFKTGSPWGYRVGIGYVYSERSNMLAHSRSLQGPDIPLELNYLLGKKSSKLELGLGVNFGYYKEKYNNYGMVPVGEDHGVTVYESVLIGKDSHSTWGYYYYGNIGYRYQSKKGFQFRAGVIPSIQPNGKHGVKRVFTPYVSIGYAF